MGSSGSGNFSDYSGSKSDGGKSKSGKQGGSSGKTDCDKPISNVLLDDVGTSEYFVNHLTVPPTKTFVKLRRNLYHGRLAIETLAKKEIVGFLPTKYNYLVGCLAASFSYEGEVIASSNTTIPTVRINLESV